MNPGDLVAYGPLLLAIPIAMAAGLVSFPSPCCLPLVPGYLAYVTGTAGADAHAVKARPAASPLAVAGPATTVATKQARLRRPGRTVIGTLLFVLGFAAVFTSYGAAFGAAGTLLLTYQDLIIKVLGVFTIMLGLIFAGTLSHVPLLAKSFRLSFQPRLGVASAPLLGVLFGVGWTPCIGPTLGAILTLSFTTGGAGRGALLSFVYSLGLGLPFLLAAMGVQRAFRVFAFAQRHARRVMQIGGLLLIGVGILQVTGVWASLMIQLRVLIANWQMPL